MSKNKFSNQGSKKKSSKPQNQSEPKKPNPPAQPHQATPPKATRAVNSPTASQPSAIATPGVRAESLSLDAHSHVQKYLQNHKKSAFSKEDLNATLRLSQHLRIFGLLSAVGYINQSNAQGGKVREQTVPVWGCLLGQLLRQPVDINQSEDCKRLMEFVIEMSRNQPARYMAMWRKSLILAQHWNFWARAYSEVEQCTPDPN